MGTPIRLVDETGIERFRGTQSPGGGSGPFAIIRVPIRFDTPELVLGAGGTGVVLYTPSVSDLLLLATGGLGGVFVETAWNGSSPTGYLLTQGTDWTGNTPGIAPIIAGFDMTTADTDDEGNGDIFAMSSTTQFAIGAPFRFATTAPLVFGIDDNSDGDPGSDQGEGEVVIAVCRATA